MLAHALAVAGHVFSASVLCWLGPLIIWLTKRETSRFVAFHALQSLLWQLVIMGILIVGWTIVGILCMVLIGIFLLPIMAILHFVIAIGSVILSGIAAVKANNGEWYELPLVGQWALNNSAVRN
jgi:uncharacterized Tic20 family protein